jgi:hypothetical protein
MPFLLFFLRFLTTFWVLLLPMGFWAGARRADGWRARLVEGFAWAFGAWMLAALASGMLSLLGEESDSLVTAQASQGIFLTAGLLLGVVWAARQWSRFALRQRLQDAGEALTWLHELSAAEFEGVVARYFKSLGYVVRKVGQSGDHGVDLAVYTPGNGKWIVQCKRYKRRAVGEGALRDLYGAMMHEHANRGFIFTTSTFSVYALDWAQEKEIELVDGEELVARLHQQRVSYQSAVSLRVRV